MTVPMQLSQRYDSTNAIVIHLRSCFSIRDLSVGILCDRHPHKHSQTTLGKG